MRLWGKKGEPNAEADGAAISVSRDMKVLQAAPQLSSFVRPAYELLMNEDSCEPIYFYSKTTAYFELSNFSRHGFQLDGLYWPTVEHYFQAQKFPSAPAYQEKIRQARTAKEAKSLGRSRTIPLRSDWEQVKEEVMRKALRAKFAAHSELITLLLATGSRRLVENAPSDYYWGCGHTGSGKNRLGVLLMELRATLQVEAEQVTGADRPRE